MQNKLVAGDTLNFLTCTPGYSAADGWQLQFRLVPHGSSGAAITVGSIAEGESHRTQVPPITTAAWVAGLYSWSSWVERSGETYTVNSGTISIAPNPRTVPAGYDGRSQLRKALDDAKAALANYNPTQRSYKIADREKVFNTAAEIIKYITYLEQQVAAEEAAKNGGSGPAVTRRILTRL
ncbi:MAG: hypothetical protein ACRCV9_16430 [Burkholderiaceae bacterium]